ncbi:unnamed protein product [Porites lobata]|uniref:CCHC-type domain-containing protein n=1 Tax=Porites lobata TaxID=104759 RepID=A0ABN8QG68_9CNID|nr:unnamed protein product [Porites lobata]
MQCSSSLGEMQDFVEKRLEERLQVMRKAQLCHNCFKCGHIAVGCLARSTCEVQVRSRDANKAVETYALLDSGSVISLCDKTLARELGIRGQEKTFFLTTQEREDSPRVGHDQPNRRVT